MKKIGVIVEKASNFVAWFSFLFVAALVVLNVADVLLYKLTGSSIKGAYELSQCILQCAVFASFAYGQTQKTHIHMTLFIDQLPGRLKYIPFFLCSVISTALACFVTYASFYQANRQITSNAMTEILHIPLFPFYYVQAVCMVVFSISLLYDTILAFLAIFKDEYAELVHAHW